jgi:4-hydroxy-L-threonine phosphate dehydrogenase PdxA
VKQKPLLIITMGDPAGIGPEIIAKVIDSGEIFPLCRPVVVGDAGVMKKLIEDMRLSVTVRSIASLADSDPPSTHGAGLTFRRARRPWNTSRRPLYSP